MAHRTTLNISLTPELSKYIDTQLETGLYTSSSELIREALRIFKDYNEVKANTILEMKKQIEAGIEQANAGEVIDGEQAFTELEKDL